MATKPSKPTKKAPAARKAAGASARVDKHPLKVTAKEWDRQAVMDVICDALASSSKAVTTILKEGHNGYDLPPFSTIAKWFNEPADPETGINPYVEQYARAKEAQAEFMAEELAELHNKAWVPVIDPETGKVVLNADGSPLMTVDKASAAIARLEADNKKWLMGKLKPKRFGEKVQQEHTGPNGGAIEVKSTVTLVQAPARTDDEQ